MPRRGVVIPTGVHQEAGNKYRASWPAFTGRHLWVFLGMWQVANPAARAQTFDNENMISVEGPACLWCEQEWRADIGAHCRGGAA